jgi:hypothetical protein
MFSIKILLPRHSQAFSDVTRIFTLDPGSCRSCSAGLVRLLPPHKICLPPSRTTIVKNLFPPPSRARLLAPITFALSIRLPSSVPRHFLFPSLSHFLPPSLASLFPPLLAPLLLSPTVRGELQAQPRRAVRCFERRDPWPAPRPPAPAASAPPAAEPEVGRRRRRNRG